MPEHPLAARVVVITGASAGIGLALAEHLHTLGSRVVINARRRDRLDTVAARLNAQRPRSAVAVAGDAADPRVIDSMFAAASDAFNAEADAVIVNAGRGLNGSVLSSDTAQWEELVRTNLLGAAHLIRAAAKRLLPLVPSDQLGQHGTWVKSPRDIVILGSVVGRHVSPFSSMYGSTKFAVHGLAEGARRELGPKGVRVSLIEPAFVVSEFQSVAGYDQAWFEGVKEKFAPMLEPMDIARMIAFVLQQPAHVHISDLLVRPTRQEYP